MRQDIIGWPPGTGLLTGMLLAALLLALLIGVLGLSGARINHKWLTQRLADDNTAHRQWARALADAAFEGLLIHRKGVILQMNRALVRLLGCREIEMIGQSFAALARPDQVAALRAELEAPQPQFAEFSLLRPGKPDLLVEISSQSIDYDGGPATITAIRDISQKREDAARIERLAHYDALTDLPNRKLFYAQVAASVARNDREGGTTALFKIDLDQFKTINEQIGRSAGDQLLRQIAARIQTLTAKSDLVARIGGDRFGVVLPSSGTANRAITLAGQLEAAFSEPFIINGQLVKAVVSIGIAIFPEHAADADGLLKAADFALEQARRAGGGFSHMYSHEEAQGFRSTIRQDFSSAAMSQSQRLAQDLRKAVTGGEISLMYQPIFRCADLALVGFEALARWNHKQDGLIPPSVFIPLAEQIGLIHEIGSFVLETACTEAASRAATLKMAVNLSPVQFRDVNLPARIGAILRKTGLAAGRLELEVTESLFAENTAVAAQTLQALRVVGVGVALDDFGSAHSDLSHLYDLPFTRLKIDQRVVQSLGTDRNADAIVTAILALAANLRLEVTAEGVETEAQLAYLQKTGCHWLQGFLLGQPSPRAVVDNIALPSGQGLNMAAPRMKLRV